MQGKSRELIQSNTMQHKKALITVLGILIIAALIVLFVFSRKTPTDQDGNGVLNGNIEGDAEQISRQINTGPDANGSVQYPLPSFSPNINYISNINGDNITIEQKRNMLTFAGNIVNLALSYEEHELRNASALARYASTEGKKSLEQLKAQHASAKQESQYAVIDSSKPIGLFPSTTRQGAYILSFEVSLFEPNTTTPNLKPFARAQAEIQIFRNIDGYEFDYIYTSPL